MRSWDWSGESVEMCRCHDSYSFLSLRNITNILCFICFVLTRYHIIASIYITASGNTWSHTFYKKHFFSSAFFVFIIIMWNIKIRSFNLAFSVVTHRKVTYFSTCCIEEMRRLELCCITEVVWMYTLLNLLGQKSGYTCYLC